MADERNALLNDCCDRHPLTGEPDHASLPPDRASVIEEYDTLLRVADEALIATGTDPQPQPTNVVVLPFLSARTLRPVRAARSDGWTGGAA